ncbi:MAG TPA: ArsA family ATPase [Ilumatobacteraceae bacterium]|nr:ArsA family ATPase [Ilumatobacteraceae bacterium]
MPPKSVDPLQFLTTAKVAIVAGKGGVGKTTVTGVLARAAIRRGLRVLVVELDGKPSLGRLLPDVEVQQLSATAALAEYLDTHGLSRVTKRLASRGIIDVVATASPGIDDIVVLGKIKQLERSDAYDLVVVDGPAAGHAITFLLAAQSLLASVRGGPIHSQATEVLAMLTDPTRCQVVLVTLPETTPVNEAVETAYALEERVGVHLGPVVVNSVDMGPALDADAAPEGSPMRLAAEFRNARRALHRRECDRLADELALPQLHLPAVAGSHLTIESIAALADHWAPA